MRSDTRHWHKEKAGEYEHSHRGGDEPHSHNAISVGGLEITSPLLQKVAIRLHTFERSLLRIVYETSPCNCQWEDLSEAFKKQYLFNAQLVINDVKGQRSRK